MNTTPLSHRIFVADGDTDGQRIVGKSNWIGKAMLGPRPSEAKHGVGVEPAAVRSCISHAQSLLTHTHQWLNEHRPDLLSKSQ